MESPNKIREKLLTCFKNLDTVVAIEYQRMLGSKKLRLREVEGKVLGFNRQMLLAIKSIYPESYKLSRVNDQDDDIVIDNYDTSVDFLGKLSDRLKRFTVLLDLKLKGGAKEWIIEDLITYRLPAGKVRRPKASGGRIVKNDRSKFQFHERIEKKTPGSISLIQRIRAKEKNSDRLQKEIHKRKEMYIESKMRPIYDILYSESPKDGGTTSLTVSEMERLINDASPNPMAKEDIGTAVRKLDELIDGISLITVGTVNVIKVRKLDREADLEKITQS
ncbi:DEKNAAC100444 [Brettanomyces naardenensis]|uniref:DEKNAAC100444 n=1 Tax=Brettanomyces naardenensis TaxID=13370 RepID=A0A448YFK3_BRENA|nr:DEKNAAC100444 [Brettanomyces naardenensis]